MYASFRPSVATKDAETRCKVNSADGKVDYLKTVSVAVLDCKQNVSFIVIRRVVYFMKEYIIFAVNLGS